MQDLLFEASFSVPFLLFALILHILMTLPDDKLVNETDVMGIDPESLGRFKVSLHKVRWDTRRLTDEEYEEKVAAAETASKVPSQLKSSSVAVNRKEQLLWDAQKVDEESFRKDGIVYALG